MSEPAPAPDGGPARVTLPGPCPHPSHSRPPSRQATVFEIPACRVLLSLAYKRLQGFHSVAILRKSYGLDSCGAQPAPGRWHDAARPCLPRSPEAASPQAAPLSSGHATVTTTRAPRLVPRHGLSESSLAESHTASPSSMERGMLTRPRLRRSSSWRSRHRTPLRVRHTAPSHGRSRGQRLRR